MKTILKVLAAMAVIGLAGCGPQQMGKEDVQVSVLDACNAEMKRQGSGITCTEVQVVQQSPNVYVGICKFSNGWQRDVTATTDNPKSAMLQWGQSQRSVP